MHLTTVRTCEDSAETPARPGWSRQVGTLARAMKENAPTADLVRCLVRGRRKAQVVAAIRRLGTPDALGEGTVRLADLAAALGVGAARLRRLLRAARAVGLVQEEPRGCFRNTPASSLLRAGIPGSLHDEA